MLTNRAQNDCDVHIVPQSAFYDASSIDLFVDIKYLNKFLTSLGFAIPPLNQSGEEEKKHLYEEYKKLNGKYDAVLRNLYHSDYQIIANIPEAKKWKPSDR